MLAEWSDRLVAALYRFRLRSRVSGKVSRHQMISNPWHAVSIASGSELSGAPCCAAAMELQGQRFLSTEAPTLPLAGCSNPKACRCRYQHHPDRRHERRRTVDYGYRNAMYSGAERRSIVQGRRTTDT